MALLQHFCTSHLNYLKDFYHPQQLEVTDEKQSHRHSLVQLGTSLMFLTHELFFFQCARRMMQTVNKVQGAINSSRTCPFSQMKTGRDGTEVQPH